MLPQTINELSRENGGELKELVRIEERSHSGIQTEISKIKVGKVATVRLIWLI